MKINIFFEMASFINLIAVGGNLRVKHYNLIRNSYNKIRLVDRESPFELNLTRYISGNMYKVSINITYQLHNEVVFGSEVYNGPEFVEEKDWLNVLMKVRGKCICGVVMDMEYVVDRLLSKISIPSTCLLKLTARPLVSSVEFMTMDSEKSLGMVGKEILKRFVQNPETFHAAQFDNGTVIVEKNFNPISLDPLGKEIYEFNAKNIDSGVYDDVFTLPIHLIVLGSSIRNLFLGSINAYLLETLDTTGPFPLSPLQELSNQIPAGVLHKLRINGIKEVEGMWWTKEEDEGIIINNLTYC